MFISLKGKKVLITGASSGIGAATAILFSNYGAEIGLHYYSNKKGIQQVINEIEKNNGIYKPFHGDLLDMKFTRNLIKSFVGEFGKIDILVNNAGAVGDPVHFSKLQEVHLENTLSLNLVAPFFLAQQAFNYMKENKGGKIINVSSIAAKYGGGETSVHYGAAKAGIEAITKSLAKFGAKYNILVNAVRPGFIDTKFHEKMNRTNKDIQKRIDLIPLKRAGDPKDVAKLIVFLASDAGNYITGEIFNISGGD